MTTENAVAAEGDEERLFTPEFIALLSMQVAFGLAFSTFFLLPKFLTVELRAGPDEIGRIMACASGTAVLAVPLVASGIDRIGRRPLILAGTSGMALTAFGYLFVHDTGPLVHVLRALQGLSFACAFNAAGTAVTDRAPASKLGQALGIFGVSLLATNAVAPAIAEYIAARWSWSVTFIGAGAMATLAFALATRIRDKQDVTTRTGGPGWGAVLQRHTLSVLVAIGLAGVGFGALFAFHQPFALSLGIDRVSDFFVGYTAAAVLVRVGLGHIADRFGRKRVALAALFFYALVTLAMSQLAPGWLLLLGACFGFAHGLLYPALNALSLDGTPPAVRGKVMSSFNGSFNVGMTCSVLLLGAVADSSGYPIVFVIAAGATLASVPLLAGFARNT